MPIEFGVWDCMGSIAGVDMVGVAIDIFPNDSGGVGNCRDGDAWLGGDVVKFGVGVVFGGVSSSGAAKSSLCMKSGGK
jgi:hypothetical protein